MSLEMAHKVILPPKKNYIPQFLKQRDINSYNRLCLPNACCINRGVGSGGRSNITPHYQPISQLIRVQRTIIYDDVTPRYSPFYPF
jgi:hypothetical protein